MSSDFETIFGTLRGTMLEVVDGALMVTDDKPGSLTVKSQRLDAKGQPVWFGTVTIKRSYVAYHLMTLYEHPELAAGISDDLAKRKQGKTCFNFKKSDQALFDELAELTKSAHAVEIQTSAT
ncbi:MAG: hypothetical protein AAGL10_14400 [Pseudomonadota bacterium]